VCRGRSGRRGARPAAAPGAGPAAGEPLADLTQRYQLARYADHETPTDLTHARAAWETLRAWVERGERDGS